MIDLTNEVEQMFAAQEKQREEIRNQALKVIYDNQEVFVAQWILQNPYAKISDYRLKFVYNDSTHMGYTVEMEKIDV